ncbi:MAG: DUF2752 domain-containing protein [Clostridiales bacterium]|nr:DUF2752 domain-containing protein [Clostridiales bacterium]
MNQGTEKAHCTDGMLTDNRKKRQKQWTGFILFNSAILLGAALLMPYRQLASGALDKYLFCFANRFLHLYCPSCGITRALDSILHLHFIEAAKQNICVLALVLLVAYFDLRAFIALLRREDTVLKVKWVYVWVFTAFFIVFAVVRNLLLVYAGIDPLGDNKAFWGW